jgi:probable F420-dependent oxidoreductase
MRIGIQHGMGDPAWQPEILAPKAVLSFARAVERGGYSHLAFTDHPAPSAKWVASGGEGVADLFTALAFCAAATERIRLLTWVVVVPYHNPFVLAHRVATLDALSGGRLTLGVGTGYLKSEFRAVGADFDRRREDFDENLSILLEALTGGDVSAENARFSARAVQVQPPTAQRPHPPLWIHGNASFGLERAASVGDGWVGLFTTDQSVRTIRTAALPDLAAFEHRVAVLRDAVSRAGRRIEDVEVVATGVMPVVDSRIGWNKDEIGERIQALEELGVSTMVVNACGDDAIASEESVIQFAEDFLT